MNFNYSKHLLRKNPLIGLNMVKKPQRRSNFEPALELFNPTYHNTYKNLLKEEMYIPKMDLCFVPNYMKLMEKRKALAKPSIYPIYMSTTYARIWYRWSWYFVFLSTIYSFNQIYYVISHH